MNTVRYQSKAGICDRGQSQLGFSGPLALLICGRAAACAVAMPTSCKRSGHIQHCPGLWQKTKPELLTSLACCDGLQSSMRTNNATSTVLGWGGASAPPPKPPFACGGLGGRGCVPPEQCKCYSTMIHQRTHHHPTPVPPHATNSIAHTTIPSPSLPQRAPLSLSWP